MIIKGAETKAELEGILALQRQNFEESLSAEEIASEGFVTVRHDLITLQEMNHHQKQIIAVNSGSVVGYALVMDRALRASIPVLMPLFDLFEKIQYRKKLLAESNYYVMGQICISKAYRGQGLFSQLYDGHRTRLQDRFDLCVTSVSKRNVRSLKAHKNYGFKEIHAFRDQSDDWEVLLLDWRF